MKLYLMQHAQAKSEQEDPRRGITDEGRDTARKMAAHFAGLKPEIAEIRHSGKLRAVQTARLVAEALGSHDLCKECAGLAPNDPAEPLLQELQGASRSLLIVGHLPHLKILASLLLCGSKDTDPIAFHNTGIVCMSKTDQKWQVEWVLHPCLLPV
jgi:phosphohistidine phosphatase